jgi:queuine tRNA-ribosyltransferase
VCERFSRGYIRHLLVIGEPTGGRLLTVHNLSWLLAFVDRIHDAVKSGTLSDLRKRVAAIWEPGPLR